MRCLGKSIGSAGALASTPGTLIHTEDGLIPIEEIKPDQLVWAEDPETGERALKRVVCLFRNEKYELVHLQVKGETFTTTVGHPFFVQGNGWVAAKELVVGDKLELQDGGDAYVDAITTKQFEEPVKVYNFEVEDFHTYFVGLSCVLVHNMCAKAKKSNTGRGNKQTRLKQLADDDKLSSALRGEIKHDMIQIKRGKRSNIRVPKGYELSHWIGHEARKGYDYLHSSLSMIAQHRSHTRIFKG